MPHKSRNKTNKFNAKQYLRENWGAPFIITFMILLIICASLLALGNSELANDIAVYAYYFLVAGVILQLASYLKYGRKEDQPND